MSSITLEGIPEPLCLPPGIEITSAQPDSVGEHNQVFRCEGRVESKPIVFFLKVYRTPEINLPIERDLLPALAQHGLPVPQVLFAVGDPVPCLALSAVPGHILQDFIDPRRSRYDRSGVLDYLQGYGQALGSLHASRLRYNPLTRQGLYGLMDQQRQEYAQFSRLLSWIDNNKPIASDYVLAHGDLHTAHVFFEDRAVSGMIDWESSGMGWREFDLAWILRARLVFLNTPAERDAILMGYCSRSSYDPLALQWCEVLMYLHFAHWSRGDGSGYETFALRRAHELAGVQK